MVLQETKIRLSKAVCLKDALTGEPVTSGIWIHSLSGGRMEKKSGGVVLFLDANGPEIVAKVESGIYQPRKICLKPDGGEELEEVLMYPSPAYPKRAGYTAVKGKAQPGSILRFHIEDEKNVCRLFESYGKGKEQISFYFKSKMAGTLWYIRRKTEPSGTYFALKNRAADAESYCLKEPLKGDYQIKDTVIYPAQETIADENGEFYILFLELPQKKCLLSCSYGKTGEQKEVEIFSGTENVISGEGAKIWDYV